MNFDFKSPGRIISKIGCSTDSELYSNLPIRGKILLITDKTLMRLGIALEIKNAIEKGGSEVIVFDNVEPEPKTIIVDRAIEFSRSEDIEVVIGVGGGSVMDIAKIVSLLLKTPQDLTSIFGVGNCKGERLPLVLIATTAGTGSEATPVAVVTAKDGQKSPIVDPVLICDIVLLDASLTLGLPARITAATGVDAMVHAIEAYTSGVRKNIISDKLAIQALRLLYQNISLAVHEGNNLTARENMLVGSMLAGLAFANSTVGAVHALSYPLGANFNLPHGESNALVMIPVMEFNSKKAFHLYGTLYKNIHPEKADLDDMIACDLLLKSLDELIRNIGLPSRLSEYGITDKNLVALTQGTMQQERLLSYNYSKMGYSDIYRIFQQLL